MIRLLVHLCAAVAVLCTASACAAVADKADEATSAAASAAKSLAKSWSDPWRAGCAAVDIGLRVNHLDRSAQLRILDGIAASPTIGDDLRSWLRLARTALAYTDPISGDARERAALNGPCVRHGHPIAAIGGRSK
jgi:hypothetical protein